MTSAPKPKRVFDVDLFEFAAKAAGITLEWWDDGGSLNPGYVVNSEGDWVSWDPLTNDGDALRLAVALRLSIDHNHSADQQRWVAADRQGCEGCYSPVSCIEDEFDESQRDTATRRAIVRAAAEIGRRMKS